MSFIAGQIDAPFPAEPQKKRDLYDRRCDECEDPPIDVHNQERKSHSGVCVDRSGYGQQDADQSQIHKHQPM